MCGKSVAAAIACGLCGIVWPAAADSPRRLVLEELLDRSWSNEPVSFIIKAGVGECHPDSVRLHGPDGPTACQLSDVETWPGTPFLKSGRLWFVTGLEPLERRVYVVECGPLPAEGPQPAEDLRVQRREGMVEFTTSGFGARLLLDEPARGFPVASDEAPGPVREMRLAIRPGSAATNGTWFGGSALYGPTKIRAWSAQRVADGPVFGAVQYRWEYEDGNRLDLKVEALAEPLASPAYGGRHEGFCK